MLTIKELTVKNFMSVGNQTQAIDFGNKSLVLVIGENMTQVLEMEQVKQRS